MKNHQAKKLLMISGANLLVILILLIISRSSNSLALTAFTYLIIFDFLSVLTGLLNIWIKFQVINDQYPYGYKRCEVLAIFSCAIVTILGAFFIIKECAETFFEENTVHTSRMMPAIIIGFIMHMFVTLSAKNDSLDYVVKSSASSWLQEHMSDLSESACRYIPGLSKILLPRMNPFLLVGFADLFVLIGTYFSLQIGSSYIMDTYAAITIAIMTIGTMLPFAVYTGKILLQTTPSHLLTQLDKSLREASTLDGVLEFRDEHFWTLSFGVLAGSLHVRVRRDADEQLVLAHVWNKLAGIVQILTIHIFKDDWMRRTTHQLVFNQKNINLQQQPPVINFNPTHFSADNSSSQNIPKSKPFVNSSAQGSPRSSRKSPSIDNEYVIVNP